jgi:hypothetical protein
MLRESARDCRLHAEDCIGFAERMSDPQQKSILLLVAKAWLVLATFTEMMNFAADDRLPPTER